MKHELRCKGYVRYMDDFLLFSRDKEELRQWGRQIKQWVVEHLGLEVHPDKYRLLPICCGVDFCGFVVFADGRIRVRTSAARRFQKRYRHKLRLAHAKKVKFSAVRASVIAWAGHVKHAQSYGLRRAVFCAAGGRIRRPRLR